MKRVGDRLFELRKHLGMTQEEFAAQLGIKRSAMGKLERGEYYLNSKKLQILASRYNVSMDYFLCGRGKLFYDKTENERVSETNFEEEMDDEMKEMISLMLRVPLVRHWLMSQFQQFRIENEAIIERQIEKQAAKGSQGVSI